MLQVGLRRGLAIAGSENIANRKVMLFIPIEDTAYDNVYLTTPDNACYKLSFGMGKATPLPGISRQNFISPAIGFSELATKEFEDF